MQNKQPTIISIVMGSDSDLTVMQAAASFLQQLNIAFELTIVSAHRTPQRLMSYAATANQRGIQVIIAGAGGAAHLPGMIASITTLPVIGVPIKSSNSIDGWDSILSILQMPNGVPVATVALNAAKNAAILAAQIIALQNKNIAEALEHFKQTMQAEVENKITETAKIWNNEFDKRK
ncbi:MAG TPA: 5-(carboxyamino)imidazole ribonucleotide mutase [Chitinophagaceae bacterium]|nr:5-(carboxyamino)imidazole ribonucleotide mutase [Chitinophagaceae bacterium]HNE93951.1 5-(carboxyamino)imidazole ribonucleotide mutase [Chitinophagaceae bacterium]HNF30497.1 5-(carboxyamino)imidazole ribonucleotide mutase [Chitinophagaceae bacterium]HNL82851.1 5-(carboxyamino)imidazole ribonucleotide mutase [Chitinophagaceae bacterium]HNM34659.1 5-(carboxyamino)imidazole ribonucleotide mutase [Chitinophagaceae bacterium]